MKYCVDEWVSTKFVQMVAPGSKTDLGQGVLGSKIKCMYT